MDLHSRLDPKFRILVLILLCSITDSESGLTVNVTCREQMICAPRDSSVFLTCSYQKLNVRTGFWFSSKQKAKWRSQDHPEDLTLDQDFAGRIVYAEVTSEKANLRITDLRLEDNGAYSFILITEEGEKYFSSAGVTVEVTDLQVKYVQEHHMLSCQASCPLSLRREHSYFWMRNGQHCRSPSLDSLHLQNNETGSFSCAVRGFTDSFSDPLCLTTDMCWNVKYSGRRVCVLEGSSLNVTGFFSYPAGKTVQKVHWNYLNSQDSQEDMMFQEQFISRARYSYNGDSCTLKIRSLTKNDSGEYNLKIRISDPFYYSGNPGVVVSVTDLQVKASLSNPENLAEVMLTCSTSCTLPQHTNFIWYKNGKLVTDKLTRYNKLYLNCAEDEGQYSCAVRGREDQPSPADFVKSCRKGQKRSSYWIILTIAGVAAVGVLISVVLVTKIRRKKRAESTEDVQNGSPENRTYASLNPMTISADYSTLAEVRESPVYINRLMVPAPRLPDYENTSM